MNFARLTTVITDFADRFIPAELKKDRDRLNQARVFLISHLFGPFMGLTVPAALFLLDPTPDYDVAVLALSILGFWAFPPLLKATGQYRILALISVQNLIFCILWSCYFYGGITSPTLSWVLIIPLLAFFYIGHSAFMRGMVVGLFSLNVAAFLYIYGFFPAPPHGIAIKHIENLGIVSMVATSLYIAMMALYFAKVYESQSELEALARQHLAMAAELRKATAQAERAGAAKAEFLAKMSHELRTPLNAIIGYSQMLREDAMDEGDTLTIKDLDRIHEAGVHLLKLINEILDLAKIDAGKMEIYEEEVAIAEVIRSVVDSCRALLEENQNRLTVAVSGDIGPLLLDERKVSQILHQLVDNAAKFTQKGFVVIEANLFRNGPAEQVRVRVTDTGCGIDKQDLSRLFEQFTVLGDTSSSKYGGTGLGLALSRKLARLMSGDIVAVSEPGKGSSFTLKLPLKRPGIRRVAEPQRGSLPAMAGTGLAGPAAA